MKKPLIIIFLTVGLIVLGLVYRGVILDTIDFFWSRPYKNLSEEQLENRLVKVYAELAAIDQGLADMPGDVARRTLSDHSTARDLRKRAKGPLRVRDGLLAEQRWRVRRRHYVLLAGFVISTLVFLDLNRRVILHRDPRVRQKQKFDKYIQAELTKEKDGLEQSRESERLSRVDPRLRRLTPGVSSREDVLYLLGEPDERTLFLEMEAWIYHLSPGGPEAMGAGKAAAPDNVWDDLEREALRPVRKDNLIPVTVLFKGNIVHDLSMGSVKNGDQVDRIL